MYAPSKSLSKKQAQAIGLFKLYGVLMLLVFLYLVLHKLGLAEAVSPLVIVATVCLAITLFFKAYSLIPARPIPNPHLQIESSLKPRDHEDADIDLPSRPPRFTPKN